MGNEKNLIPLNKRTKDEQRDIVKKGGIASGVARRNKRTHKELVRLISSAPMSPGKTREAVKSLGIEDEDLTNGAAIAASLFKAALSGNVTAIAQWAEMQDAPSEEDKVYELPARVIGKAFVDINRNFVPNKTYIFKGGRGGLKSSFVSLKVIEIIKNNPMMHACVVRKVGNTLKDSVYAQIKWAIHELGLDDEFQAKTSPLEIIYKKTGQKIFFRGCDDPLKLKSIKPEFGYIGILWKEERDQISGPEEERSINQSVLRGGAMSYDISSYNPPKTKDSWVCKEEVMPDPNRVIHSSTYLDAPPEWLGQKFIDDAEHLREVNPEAYEHEYLGVSNGSGGMVFENVEVREISDEEIRHFDRIYQGVDFGWFPDIYAFVRCHYDADRETVYIFAEHTGNKMSNKETGQWIIDNSFDDYRITCDSAEPKSINDYKDMGIPAIPAEKGPGSIEYSFKWLCTRKVIVDPVRCPVSAEEITSYEYEKDKNGDIISGYPDHDNHAIDALRYALEQLWKRRGNQA